MSMLDSQSTTGGKISIMGDDTISAKDLAKLIETLADIIQQTGSLEELEGWLRSQHYIKSIRTADYLIKTNPPRKELLVTFKMDNGSTVTKVIDITLYPNQTLGLAEVHEP